MASREAVIRTAQRGVAMTRLFPTGRALRVPVPAALGREEQVAAVTGFLELLQELYAHLPLKRAMYGIDPLQRLRLLLHRIEAADGLDPLLFHYALAAVITGLRDAHTRYVGPPELAGRVAMLPFLIESYGSPTAPRYIVSKVATDRSLVGNRRSFRPGAEIRWWNGVPMDRAVDRHADDETGGRPDARRARALESMTLRALQYGPPPDERWVTIGYVDRDGTEREVRFDWRIVTVKQAATSGLLAAGPGERALGLNPAAETNRHVKKLLFRPELWYAERRTTAAIPAAPDAAWLPTALPDVLAARAVTVRRTRLGYLRLWSFDVADEPAYLAEVIRLLALLPERGLIVDLRANPGGLIPAAERLLQLFTPRPVEPTRFSLAATELTRAMVTAPQNEAEFEPWRASLEEAVANGEPYSRAVPITSERAANDVGQVYGGPVVTIVDANTYSSGDLFAAGMVDNRIGPLISVGEATGGGGANVWLPQQIENALHATARPHPPLPAGIGYTLAVRRATRAGAADGAAIEDVGVRGDLSYAMTSADLTGDNQDLIAFAGRVLLGLPRTELTATPPVADGDPLVVRTLGVDQLDVLVDGLYAPSHPVTRRTTRIELATGWREVELFGRADGRVVQRRRLRR